MVVVEGKENMVKKIISVYKQIINRDMTVGTAEEIEKILFSFRNLRKEFYLYPDRVLKDLFGSAVEGKLYYPCDTIELRLIIEEDQPTCPTGVFFSYDMCRKYFQQEYPLILCFNKPIICSCNCQFGGITLCNLIRFQKDIQRIYFSEFLTEVDQRKVVKGIMEEEEVFVDYAMLSDRSSLNPPKIAHAKPRFTQFKVNIEPLNVKNRIRRAKSAEEAVRAVIEQSWQAYRSKSRQSFRPAKYRDTTWLKFKGTPFWDSMVSEAQGYNKMLKEAKNLERSFKIDEDELFIFDLLNRLRNDLPELRDVQMRVAGGWVRDKLLGTPSDDIDIALSRSIGSEEGITGEEFVESIYDYAQSILGDKNPLKDKWIIEANEQKSKNIAPAALSIETPSGNVYKVEFVNLRTEIYDPTSRVPVTGITNDPEEDAQRRDLTINSMFYNLGDDIIEDYVGGEEDLANKFLRTPLDPKKTFMDDPLRMLRVLRFYSRYPNAKIDPSILQAFRDPEVQKAYMKLAPERASTEIMKMMAGSRPADAARILFETGLYKKVFQIPDNFSNIGMDQRTPYHNLNLMEHTLSVMKNIDILAKRENFDPKERMLLNLSAMLHDFGKMHPDIPKPHPKDTSRMRYIGHDRASADFTKDVLTRMGFDQDVKEFVGTVVKHHMYPHSSAGLKGMGKFLKDVDKLYRAIMIHGEADALGKGRLEQQEIDQITEQSRGSLEQIELYRQQMGARISKPLLDGNRVREILLEVTPEMVNGNGFITTSKHPHPMHHIAWALQRMLEQQWMQNIMTTEQAEQFIRGQAKNWENLWRQQKKASGMLMFRKADASSGADPSGFDGAGPEGTMDAPWERMQEIYNGPQAMGIDFIVGDIVTLRYGPQAEGIISEITNSEIVVHWETGPRKGKDSHISRNLATLNAMLQKKI